MLETVLWVFIWLTTGSQFSVKADDTKKKSSLFSSYVKYGKKLLLHVM
jgi:hypothetical protein